MHLATLKQAIELVEPHPFGSEAAAMLEAMADVLPIHVHEPGARLDALRVEGVAIYSGDVHVAGLLEGAPASHGTLLVVLGDLHAEDVIFFGPMIVTGEMDVARAAYFHSRGDWGLYVGGSLRAGLLVEHEHDLNVRGELVAPHVHRRGGDPRALFVDDVLAEQGQRWRLDSALMMRAIREGRSVVRPPAPAISSRT